MSEKIAANGIFSLFFSMFNQ